MKEKRQKQPKNEHWIKSEIRKRGLRITWVAQQIHIDQPLLSIFLNGQRFMPESIEENLKTLILPIKLTSDKIA